MEVFGTGEENQDVMSGNGGVCLEWQCVDWRYRPEQQPEQKPCKTEDT